MVQQTIWHFLRAADAESFAVVAYCVMPDHVHLVVEGRSPTANVRRFVRHAKQRAGYWFSQRRGSRLWQQNYFDRTLRREDSLADVVHYVIANPIRAGLVEDVSAYRYWGSGLYTREELLDYLRASASGS